MWHCTATDQLNDSDMSMNIGNADDAQSGAELLPGVELRTMALWSVDR